MDLQIVTKNDVQISEATRDYVQKRIGKLSRYLPSISAGRVEVSHEGAKLPEKRFIVQVTLDSKGVLIRAQEKAEDIGTAIDKVTDALTNRIRRYKGKLYDKGRGVSLSRQGAQEEKMEAPMTVVKNKNFLISTLPEDEAISQMELLGHDFFLFVNAESGNMNLLYRREDGNYGLIEPHVG